MSGEVQGYARRFWQLSPDHRGTPEMPGRVVTIVPQQGSSVWGMAYLVPEEHTKQTKEYLDFRERAGYRCDEVMFHPDDKSPPFPLNVYISIGEDNPLNKPSEDDQIAHDIIKSRGHSGTNLEYALRLADGVRRMAPHVKDDHLFGIEKRLLQLCEERKIVDKVLFDIGYKLDYLHPHLLQHEHVDHDQRNQCFNCTVTNQKLYLSNNIQFRVKRQYCLNYPCPPGSTPDVPNWGYYNYYNYPYYGY
ncbi:hypothetical protein QR680_003520 [Steinernema hermaphroditum]|uniref:glutathione-specific gamma-glutamylcyclotransferase n=1 Tax=Steinernema hermaphroditum TaxID=289476 RepID=A0AA39HMW7_9BILA|nr:hypothetical protein QR680_003520 [Steinernema hermaphroditum]